VTLRPQKKTRQDGLGEPGVKNRYIENGAIAFTPEGWTCATAARPIDRVSGILDAQPNSWKRHQYG